MKFSISRLSDWRGGRSPIEGSFKDGDGWSIEIPDLAALMELVSAAKDSLVVDNDSIIIYDDYME